VLTIAGSDPTAGAGIQADLKAIEASGAYAATAITSITVQDSRGVSRAETVAPELIRAQIEAVLRDLGVSAVKTGMLPDAATVDVVADLLEGRPELPLIVDPVLRSTGGYALADDDLCDALVARLVPRATLITPNADEAALLTGRPVEDLEQARQAGEALRRSGARAVLIKGGHLVRDRGTDLLVRDQGTRTFRGEWIDTPHTHGTGCVYAASIAARVATGVGWIQAIEASRAYLTEAIRHGLPLGSAKGPTDPLFRLHSEQGRSRHRAGSLR
jgi:hydroxymethylpyrimidine/phosphomethylpyrimidine kinase